jgi:hypothetical protein
MVEGCKFVDEVVPNCPCELRVYCLVRFVT